RRLSRFTWWATTRITKLPQLADWRRPQVELDESSRAAALEAVVDIHTFVPAELAALAREQGAADVKVTTSELFASWFGWPVRTFECAVPKEKLGMRWANFALHGWQRLARLDERLEKFVAPGLFYNAEITGRKPS
ncbi:MAG: hypothetical protein QOJ34_1443, partial [Pseudonocardiales bacterium]|nr:hypothetical protein [Pseudonocardiales bacterium]